tara:strand:+ start:1249 stop:1608 length:360 start_codon:yes stop_codon:yes gene_type:complete
MSSRSILKSKIEQYIDMKSDYDNALKYMEEIRNKKNNLENEISDIMKNLNMEGKTIIVNDTKIIQKQINISQNLTFKYIEGVLEKYNSENKNTHINTKELLKYIKNNRPKYVKNEIKIN